VTETCSFATFDCNYWALDLTTVAWQAVAMAYWSWPSGFDFTNAYISHCRGRPNFCFRFSAGVGKNNPSFGFVSFSVDWAAASSGFSRKCQYVLVWTETGFILLQLCILLPLLWTGPGHRTYRHSAQLLTLVSLSCYCRTLRLIWALRQLQHLSAGSGTDVHCLM